jgi:lysozyme
MPRLRPTAGLLAVLAILLVSACGGGSRRPEPVPTRAVATTAVRFADHDPFDWVGVPPWLYPVHGIDVSKYQGDIDWPRVRASGVSFAFIKATEGGDHLDERFLDNWSAAGRAGMPRGAYHFYYFCRPAAEQAAWFIRHVPREASALPPVLDLEWNHKSRTCPWRPDPEMVRREATIFLEAIAGHYGRRPLIYSTTDFYHENALWRIRGADFWLRSVAGHPSETYPGRNWTIWQYTGTGSVAGIAGPTDINAFAGSHTQWAAWAGRR